MEESRKAALEVADLVGELFTPLTIFIPFVLAAWCLGSELQILGDFPLSGVLAHWMLWTAVGTSAILAKRTMDQRNSNKTQGE